MKCLILAAGQGKRIKHITKTTHGEIIYKHEYKNIFTSTIQN